jgi:hypothetical protein
MELMTITVKAFFLVFSELRCEVIVCFVAKKDLFAYPLFALIRQQLKTENIKLNIYTQYLMKSTFENI